MSPTPRVRPAPDCKHTCVVHVFAHKNIPKHNVDTYYIPALAASACALPLTTLAAYHPGSYTSSFVITKVVVVPAEPGIYPELEPKSRLNAPSVMAASKEKWPIFEDATGKNVLKSAWVFDTPGKMPIVIAMDNSFPTHPLVAVTANALSRDLGSAGTTATLGITELLVLTTDLCDKVHIYIYPHVPVYILAARVISGRTRRVGDAESMRAEGAGTFYRTGRITQSGGGLRNGNEMCEVDSGMSVCGFGRGRGLGGRSGKDAAVPARGSGRGGKYPASAHPQKYRARLGPVRVPRLLGQAPPRLYPDFGVSLQPRLCPPSSCTKQNLVPHGPLYEEIWRDENAELDEKKRDATSSHAPAFAKARRTPSRPGTRTGPYDCRSRSRVRQSMRAPSKSATAR
ncbi:hypothetical protein BKA70DRAFT_1233808 [Coprinopsis sp. MPI-PUGE-AT-0042]|nr:hypothetical protein BKA70DRAFT_1233808 [Coprinopsis sp. MPI-PUGE-AT-0042]